MNEIIVRYLKTIEDAQLNAAATQLGETLARDMADSGASGEFSESRAKALLLAANALDEPTLNDFRRMMSNHKVVRVALGDLLESVDSEQLTVNSGRISDGSPDWLAIALSAFAMKHEYDVADLDPSSPPSQHSPAGQVVHHAAAWVRRQVSRAPIDREKIARGLAFSGQSSVISEQLREAEHVTRNTQQLPQPPAQIPVRYFEYNEPIAIDPNEPVAPPASPVPLVRGEQISISEDDLREPEDEIQILGASRRVAPLGGVPVPPSADEPSRIAEAARNASNRVRETVTRENVTAATQRVVQGTESVFNQIRESISTESTTDMGRTRLRVSVMDYPNGHGLAAVQTFVRYTGSRKEVAGATANDGEFIVSLPAKRGNGITYEVTVHWPREFGGKKEKKRITVNPERPEFHLPFYSRLVP